MTSESILPPYTIQERSREVLMRSMALRWRARRACTRSWQLRNESEKLLISLRRFMLALPCSSLPHLYRDRSRSRLHFCHRLPLPSRFHDNPQGTVDIQGKPADGEMRVKNRDTPV